MPAETPSLAAWKPNSLRSCQQHGSNHVLSDPVRAFIQLPWLLLLGYGGVQMERTSLLPAGITGCDRGIENVAFFRDGIVATRDT